MKACWQVIIAPLPDIAAKVNITVSSSRVDDSWVYLRVGDLLGCIFQFLVWKRHHCEHLQPSKFSIFLKCCCSCIRALVNFDPAITYWLILPLIFQPIHTPKKTVHAAIFRQGSVFINLGVSVRAASDVTSGLTLCTQELVRVHGQSKSSNKKIKQASGLV